MRFNDHQLRLWRHMITLIEDFEKNAIPYEDMVYGLGGALDAGEFKDEEMKNEWYNRWGPFEEFYAVKGNETTVEEVMRFIIDMKTFLNDTLHRLVQE